MGNCNCFCCKGKRRERCGKNAGRYIDGHTLEKYYCIDREECRQNVIAENTEISFYKDKIEIEQFGKKMISVEKDKK